MEANSNIGLAQQHEEFNFKFISEDRLNAIAQRVKYDRKKKLEDEAWFNFLAKKNKPEIRIPVTRHVDHESHAIQQQHQSVHDQISSSISNAKKSKPMQCVEITSCPNLTHAESNINVSEIVSIPEETSENTVNSLAVPCRHLIGGERVEPVMAMLDNQLISSDCYQLQKEEISFTSAVRGAESGHSLLENYASSVINVKEILHGAAHLYNYKQRSESDGVSIDSFEHHDDPVEERILNGTICKVNKACLEQLKALWQKMLLNLDGIVSFCVLTLCEQDNSEERLLRQLKATEFTALFARNYVYSLRRKMQMLHELVETAQVVHQNTRSTTKIHASLVAAHQAANNALVIYLKRIPCPVGEGVPDKLSELLQLVIEMCAMCRLFGIERDDLKKGPNDVERKCKSTLIQIQDQRNQRLTSINEKHNKLPVDNKKVTKQKPKNKLSKHYSLAMYKPTPSLASQTIPKGFKFKIRNLAKAKFGPPPKKPSEPLQLKTMSNEQKAWKRHHLESASPQKIQQNTKPQKPHIVHDDTIELAGKFDDSDNIHTMVELFGQKEVSKNPEANQRPFTNKRIRTKGGLNQIKERRDEVGSAVSISTAGDGNMSKQQQPVKLGAANAQLILLPPYQPSSSEQLIEDDQEQTSQGCNETSRHGEWQQRLQQQRYDQPIHTEHSIRSPKTTEVLNTTHHFHNECTAVSSPKCKVHGTCASQKNVQPSHTKCLQVLSSCTPSGVHFISEQSRVFESLNASIVDLKTSHANMNQLLMVIQKQQQQVIEAQGEVPQAQLDRRGHDKVLVQSNSSAASLDVSDEQLSEVCKYVNQFKGVSKTTSVKKQQLKPWRVLEVLSNQVVDSALRSVVAELDFESLLSNMYRLEFQ